MEKYGDHFNIDVFVAVTNCYSIKVANTVVIDHFFRSTGMCKYSNIDKHRSVHGKY